jgi:predicted transcriptional regulator
MSIDYYKIEKNLISEIKLTILQSKIFLLVVTKGKMTAEQISKNLEISLTDASKTSNELIALGAFIDMPNDEFEAMHPRFTAVNMYRKMCEREKIEFKKNLTVDNIGVILEKPYDDARTKYNKPK